MPEIKDIPYLGENRKEKMDAYLPSGVSGQPFPTIVLIHGGGWRIGDKADSREVNIAQALIKQGYAVFSINYLLNEGEKDAAGNMNLTSIAWPQNFHDCKSAVRYLRANADKYGIDSTRIGVIGTSAGGHLAMLMGGTQDHEKINKEGLYTEQSNHVSCIVSFYGDFDIRGRKVSPFAGASKKETMLNEEAASPITYIDHTFPPIFISHGTADQIVSVERSRALTRHLQSLGVEYNYLEIAKAGHSYDLKPEQMDIEPTLLSFLGKYL